ncbi:hypothetical protein C5Y97_23355 [Blastopirellula marina]|nr:hypothetical protein C5Y97_23355 [Blastopirellula marina]
MAAASSSTWALSLNNQLSSCRLSLGWPGASRVRCSSP